MRVKRRKREAEGEVDGERWLRKAGDLRKKGRRRSMAAVVRRFGASRRKEEKRREQSSAAVATHERAVHSPRRSMQA
jgi:hypothetical protein